MKHLKLFEGFNTDKWLEPEEVKPGMTGILNRKDTGERYAIKVVRIQKIGDMSADDYKNFRKHNSGWMPPYIRDIIKYDKNNENVEAEYPEVLEEYLVLVETHPKTETTEALYEVYFYDENEIAVPAALRWKSSKPLDDMNTVTGVFDLNAE